MLSTTPTPQNRASRGRARGLKTRVWGFCRRPATRAPVFGAQATKSRRVAKAAATKTASGPSQWLSRDPIEENGGANLYEMVNNNAVNRWDYLGLVTLDSDGHVIPDGDFQGNDHFIVRKCEILIIYGHRTRSDRRVRITTLGCSAAAGDVCNPGSVNSHISHLLDGAETHDDTMLFTDRFDTAEEEEQQGAGNPIRISRGMGIERDGNVVLARLREAARKKAEELKKNCKCKSVTIYEIRRGLGPASLPATTL